ncbi:DUF1214 domain-containing protein [Nocardia thailandica]
MGAVVDVDNFARIESDAMIAKMLPIVGGLGVFHHDRALAPLDEQPVIRQNRDTLYSVAITAIVGEGATLTIPDAGGRYLSVMVINQNHYINRVFHRAGTYPLTTGEFDTEYVVIGVRILFDPDDPADIDEVHRIQDGLAVTAARQPEFDPPEVDQGSYRQVREALLVLARTMNGLTRCFGRREDVDPVHHLVASASAWGGLPDAEAAYISVYPDLPVGRYTMTFRDVPAEAFWSLSVYNRDGYFEPGPDAITNVNSVFAHKDADGSVTVHLGAEDGVPNRIPLPPGWNLLIRLYRPRLDDIASWSVPVIEPA